jgi:hypothetical protein
MSGGGGTADPDEATELRAFIRKREAELEGIQGQIDKLKSALDKEPFEPVGRLKSSEAANTELQRLYEDKAAAQKLLGGYNQRLLLLQQAAAGGCIHHKLRAYLLWGIVCLTCTQSRRIIMWLLHMFTDLLQFWFRGDNSCLPFREWSPLACSLYMRLLTQRRLHPSHQASFKLVEYHICQAQLTHACPACRLLCCACARTHLLPSRDRHDTCGVQVSFNT